ncbi:MAG: hypothetical protein BAJALOKI1v1_2180001 [Promethearchaeota archaeon]|nr:MAG: hypothetical protein BAJALOKI1v1_2180001 [Candidatus Lokiarchaeota archaeon]
MKNKEYNKKNDKVQKVYQYAKLIVFEGGYKEQINYLRDLIENKPYKTISIKEFFKQYIWVVFTCGFKADYVRKHWTAIKKMCCDFDVKKTTEFSADELLKLSPIKNKKKINAIEQSCKIIDEVFVNNVQEIKCKKDAQTLLKKLPFIGEITVYHIMRNIGIDCFKPDRHIVHITKELSISKKDLFEILCSTHREYMGVIDYILWRASATLHDMHPNSSLVEYALKEKNLNDIPQNESKNSTFLF